MLDSIFVNTVAASVFVTGASDGGSCFGDDFLNSLSWAIAIASNESVATENANFCFAIVSYLTPIQTDFVA